MATLPRRLLVSRIGPDSRHPTWLAPAADRAFDVFLSAYDDAVAEPSGPGVRFERRPGRKVAGYAGFLRDHVELLQTYDYVALFDDDLIINAAALSQLFAITEAYQLKIAQPALSHDSHFTYACLLQHPGFRLRYVNFVEMMCPIFRSDVLLEAAPLFDLGYESGIDLVWCNLVGGSPTDFAVIDAVTVRHVRRIGARKSLNGFEGGKRYEDDIHAVLDRFGLPWLPCLPYGAVRGDGTFTDRRSALALPAAGLVWSVGRQRPLKGRARNLAVYWKHLLQRRAENIQVV